MADIIYDIFGFTEGQLEQAVDVIHNFFGKGEECEDPGCEYCYPKPDPTPEEEAEGDCGDPDCTLCFPPAPAPDEQAWAEVTASLNSGYVKLDALATKDQRIQTLETELKFYRGVYEGEDRINKLRLDEEMAANEEWQRLYLTAMEKILEQARVLRATDEILGKWQERSTYLQAAVEQYASHAWNDIKSVLYERGLM